MTHKPRNSNLYELALDDLTPVDALRAEPSRESIACALRMGVAPDDRVFDRALPLQLQTISRQYWTPLSVVVRVAGWLHELGVRSVVDIGSGAGKFCVATALAADCELIGLEQRPRLVKVARELARAYQVEDRVRFLQGNFGEVPTPLADAYYLYNPFGENLFGCDTRLGEDVELGGARYERDVFAVQQWLELLPMDTYLITYNGFGGRVPVGYRPVRVDRELPNVLRMWRKVSAIRRFATEHPEDPGSR